MSTETPESAKINIEIATDGSTINDSTIDINDVIMGDKITVGNINNSIGVAIGKGATATVHIYKAVQTDRTIDEITRVVLDPDKIRKIRLYVLNLMSLNSNFVLPKSGFSFHVENEMHTWGRSTFEGFLSASLFYLNYAINSADGSWGGNGHAIVNSTLMGQHLNRVWGTGKKDDTSIVKDKKTIKGLVDLWHHSDIFPIGVLSETIHRCCPAQELNSFYHGWRELCIWLTVNGLNGEQNKVERSVKDYEEAVLQAVVTYLRKYEEMETYGCGDFWLLVHYFLRSELGNMRIDGFEDEWQKHHDHSSADMFAELRKTFEFTSETMGQLAQLIASYSDEDTGFEVALLQLQTQFFYTGKPKGRLVQIKASRFRNLS